MPIYEYACSACEHEFELLVRSSSSDRPPQCPQCDSEKVVRKLSVFAARQGVSSPSASAGDGCSRCGDPNGPCSS